MRDQGQEAKRDHAPDMEQIREQTEQALQKIETEQRERLNSLADAYRKIEIPGALKGRVEEAIREAGRGPEESDRDRKRGKGIMKNRMLLRTGQTMAAALLAITVLANSGPDIAYAMEKIPVIGAITKVVTFRTYEKKEEGYEAKIQVPQVEPGSGSGMSQAAEKVNKSVMEYTDQIIAEFEADVAKSGENTHESVYTDYEVVTDNERLFTLRINTDQIMASGAQSVKIYNVDKETDRILELKDMFPAGTDYVKLLSSAVKEQMRADMQADENKAYFLDENVPAAFESIREDQNFYINSAGHMVLVFDEYEVAPGYMGVVEIEVPESVYSYQ